MNHLLRLSTSAIFSALAFSSTAQLRIVTYNTLDKPYNANTSLEAQTIFDAIANESINGIARPTDLIALQEQTFTINGSTSQTLADALNDLHGVTSYQADVIGFGDDRVSVVYNSATVSLLDSSLVAVGIRAGYRGHFRPVGYEDEGSDFYLYSVHLKAGSSSSDRAQRATETTNLRNNADALGPNTNVIFAGDFNVSSATETAYQNMFASGNAQAVDPLGISFWNASTPEVMTQSTRTSSLSDGGAGGGLDDRFDFQLVTDTLADGNGMSIITPSATGATDSSYQAFGNDGTSYNQAINNTTVGRSQSQDVLDALHDFSDHLPVVADYQLPARADITTALTQEVVFKDDPIGLIATVENTAPVETINGADALRYQISASGDTLTNDTYTGDRSPLSNAVNHIWVLDSTEAGQQSTTVDFNSQSQGVSDQEISIDFTVFDHANGSFASDTDLNEITINFGDIELESNNGTVGQLLPIFNLESTPGFTDNLLVGSPMNVSGDADTVYLFDLPATIGAGASMNQIAAIDTTEAGFFESVWSIEVSDSLDIDSAITDQLLITLKGEIVDPLAFIDGDYNGDGTVDQLDLNLVLFNWNNDEIPEDWVATDQFDGAVDQIELNQVLFNWNNQASTPDVSLLNATQIPEPRMISFATLMLIAAKRRRK